MKKIKKMLFIKMLILAVVFSLLVVNLALTMKGYIVSAIVPPLDDEVWIGRDFSEFQGVYGLPPRHFTTSGLLSYGYTIRGKYYFIYVDESKIYRISDVARRKSVCTDQPLSINRRSHHQHIFLR